MFGSSSTTKIQGPHGIEEQRGGVHGSKIDGDGDDTKDTSPKHNGNVGDGKGKGKGKGNVRGGHKVHSVHDGDASRIRPGKDTTTDIGTLDGPADKDRDSISSGKDRDGLSRFTALMLTFFLSNLLHEWIVTFSTGCFYPILFLMFGGPGVFFAQLKTSRGTSSTFVWMMLIVGTGLLLVLYAREWYARFGCHRLPDALLPDWLHAGTVGSVVVPRSVLAYLYSGAQ